MNHVRYSALLLFVALGFACTKKDPSEPKVERVVVKELQRFDVSQGNGKLAEAGKKAEIHLLRMTARGKTLQSTRADGKTETVIVSDRPGENPISFYVEGMREGGKRRVTVPWGREHGNEHESQEPVVIEIDLVKVQ